MSGAHFWVMGSCTCLFLTSSFSLPGLAFAMLASLPPVTGLYTAIIPVLLYMIMGTSRHLSVGMEEILSFCFFLVPLQLWRNDSIINTQVFGCINPLYPDISMHILNTVSYIFISSDKENSFNNQELLSLVIISFIYVTLMCDSSVRRD